MEVHLRGGLTAFVDDDDYERVAMHKWYAYAERRSRREVWYVRGDSAADRQLMHRFLLNAPKGTPVDHRDGNGLNNTRQNIRLCSATQNIANRGPMATNTSGFKGVTLHKGTGKWQAQVQVGGRCVYLGLYVSPDLAHAESYERVAASFFPGFSRTRPFETGWVSP
jgi:hypothetical protein